MATNTDKPQGQLVLEGVLAQLRHVYAQLMDSASMARAQLHANGLLSLQIKRLESMVPEMIALQERAEGAERETRDWHAGGSLAQRYFDLCHAETDLDEALMQAFGATVTDEGETDVKTWPCEHIVYDDYDSSFELWNIKDPAWVPTVEQLNAALDLGFARGWLVYKDGTERYCRRDSIGEKKESHAGRTSDAKYLRAKLLAQVATLKSELLAQLPAIQSASQAKRIITSIFAKVFD